MKKLISALFLLLPASALAHLDHGTQAFSIGHYFTGSHLFVFAASIVVLLVLSSLVRRHLRN